MLGCGAFRECTGILAVDLQAPRALRQIGAFAFLGCTGMSEVKLPASSCCIGRAAFSRCRGLRSLRIPDTHTCVGQSVFQHCTGLIEVQLSSRLVNIESAAFQSVMCAGWGWSLLEIPACIVPTGVCRERCVAAWRRGGLAAWAAWRRSRRRVNQPD